MIYIVLRIMNTALDKATPAAQYITITIGPLPLPGQLKQPLEHRCIQHPS